MSRKIKTIALASALVLGTAFLVGCKEDGKDVSMKQKVEDMFSKKNDKQDIADVGAAERVAKMRQDDTSDAIVEGSDPALGGNLGGSRDADNWTSN